MGIFEIVLIILCSLAVLGILGFVVYRKLKGKPSGCGCGCAGCPHACSCRPRKEQ